MPECGFQEDNYILDWRIAMTFVACAVGLYSLVYLKFPKDGLKILITVFVFFFFAAVV